MWRLRNTLLHSNTPVQQWKSTKCVLSVLLQPSRPISLHLHHVSSSSSSGVTSLSISNSLSPPPRIAPALSFICIFCSLLRYLCHLPEGVVTAQTRWSRGSRWSGWQTARNWPLSSQSYPAPKPQGGSGKVHTFQAGWEVEDKERDQGLREDCITAEAVTNWFSSSNSFRLLAALQSCLKLMHIHFPISQQPCKRLEQKDGKKTDVSYCRQEYEREFKEIREGALEKETQRGMDDSLWRHISHCTSRQRCLHGLFSAVSSNGSSRACVFACV